MMMPQRKSSRGIGLLELAIIIGILGILLSLGLGIFKVLVKNQKVAETREVLSSLRESIIGYVLTRLKLPCDDAETCPSPQKRYNELSKAIDAWGKHVFYVYWGQLRDTTNICSETSTGITLRLCGPDPACSSPVQVVSDVAFVVFSSGENRNKQTRGMGRTDTSLTVDVYEYGTQADDDPAFDGDASQEGYDDLVEFVTLYQIKEKLCQGTASCVHGTSPINVYNESGATRCFNTVVVSEGTAYPVNPGDSITVRNSFFGFCFGGAIGSFTYADAAAVDADNDCEVNYTGGSTLADR